jgi:hypothetical protein
MRTTLVSPMTGIPRQNTQLSPKRSFGELSPLTGSWCLGTLVYFLDKVEFTSLVSPVSPERPVVISLQPETPMEPPPELTPTPSPSSSSEASRTPFPLAPPAAPAANPGRTSRLWNAGGPAGLAALEARDAAERQAQLATHPGKLHLDR